MTALLIQVEIEKGNRISNNNSVFKFSINSISRLIQAQMLYAIFNGSMINVTKTVLFTLVRFFISRLYFKRNNMCFNESTIEYKDKV